MRMNITKSMRALPTKKLFPVIVHDAFALVIVGTLLNLGLPHSAYAYVDPSVMTYTIQAVAGVAVALGAIAGVAFRRTRKKLFALLHIDENANKRVETRLVRMDADPKAVYDNGASGKIGRARSKTERSKKDDAPKWWQRLIPACCIAVFVAFTLLFVAPLEIVAGSSGSLVFGIETVWPGLAKLTLCAALVFALVMTLLRRRAFWVVASLLFALGLCFYLQALFMNMGLPVADGKVVDWPEHRNIALATLLAWAAIIAAVQVVSWKLPRQTAVIAAILSCALILVQGVGVASLFNNRSVELGGFNETYNLTQEGMYSLSSENNVIVFVLDTYDTQDLVRLLPDHPDMFDEFTGFTWFQDSVGSFIPTRYGAPFLQTGEYPHEDELFKTYVAERWGRSSFLSDIEAQNYSIGIYTDSLALEFTSEADRRDWVYDKTINIHPAAGDLYSERGGIRTLVKCGLYRDLPWVLKPFFWFYTDEMNNAMTVKADDSERADVYKSLYVNDDVLWYEQLKNIGLEVDDSGGYSGAYRFIHLQGTHPPYNVNPEGERVSEGTLDDRALGSMHMVAEYLRQLKDLGLYEQSTIIVTADHGIWYLTPELLDQPTSPIMLVKPAGKGSDEPMSISSAPVCACDVLPTVIDAIGGNTEPYGRTVFQFGEDEERVRYYCMTTSNGVHDLDIIQYAINGYALDMDNWHTTGISWVDDAYL